MRSCLRRSKIGFGSLTGRLRRQVVLVDQAIQDRLSPGGTDVSLTPSPPSRRSASDSVSPQLTISRPSVGILHDHRGPAGCQSRKAGIQDAVRAALTSEYHNGGTEGVNTKTKLVKRQMYGRAGFRLLRHRILLR
jgi:hypothetical protein